MNLGKQIRALRLRRGVTQEDVARHFGVTAQAVSKWETETSLPDVSLLPGLSAYFGVTMDELFSLSDDVRLERIRSMLWDVRHLPLADAENERRFLEELSRRDQGSTEALNLLAQLELHLAREHQSLARAYALEALQRRCNCTSLTWLALSMGGKRIDPRFNTHNALIAHYRAMVQQHPEDSSTHAYLIQQLIDDHRLDEAQRCVENMARHHEGYFVTVQRIKLAIARGQLAEARALWEQMGREHPEEWMVQHWIGDFQAQAGYYAAAKATLRRAIALQSAPHYTDPIDSLALVCEISGDVAGAIAARQYELDVSRREWGDVSGESIDQIRREIARLQAML